MMFGYIYKTTNVVNGKIYIGKKHSSKYLGNNYLGSGIRLTEAVKKYGKENFIVELLDVANTLEQLNTKEQYYIKLYDSQNPNTGYNLASGGDGGCVWGNPENHPSIGKDRSKENNPAYKRKWYTDGVTVLYLRPEDVVPEGFYPGTTNKPNAGRITIYSANGQRKSVKPEEVIIYKQQGWITSQEKQAEKIRLEKEQKKQLKDAQKSQRELQREQEKQNKLPRVGWSKGLTKETDARVKQMSESRKGQQTFKGHHHSEETKQILSEKRKGYKPSDESISKLSETCRNRTPEQRATVSRNCSEGQKNLCWVTDEKVSVRIHLEDLNKYINKGYRRGRAKKSS